MAVLKYKSSDGTWKTIATKGGNGVTDETDPVFSASPAASITEEKKAEWDGIVMKVEYITPNSSTIAFSGTEQRPSMKANTIYIQQGASHATEALDELNIESFEETTEPYAEYVIIFVFNSPLWGAMFSLPSYVKWANGTHPEVEPEVVYELNISRSILAGEATYCAVLTPFKPVE